MVIILTSETCIGRLWDRRQFADVLNSLLTFYSIFRWCFDLRLTLRPHFISGGKPLSTCCFTFLYLRPITAQWVGRWELLCGLSTLCFFWFCVAGFVPVCISKTLTRFPCLSDIRRNLSVNINKDR